MPAGTILRREHLVAASLVGTVVVVVGFASGLGLTHPASAGTQQAQPRTTELPPPPAPAAAPGGSPGTPSGGGPVGYVGTPAAGGGNLAIGPLTADVPTPPTSAPPTTTPPTTTPPTGTTQPACQPGLLTGLLNQVTTAVNGLPVVGSLTPALTDTLLGSCPSSTVDGPTVTPTTTAPGLLPLLIPGGGGS